MADKGGLVPRRSPRTRLARSAVRMVRRRRSTARRARVGGGPRWRARARPRERANGALGSLTFPTRKMAEPKTTPRARKVTRRRRRVIAAYPRLASGPCGTARFFRLSRRAPAPSRPRVPSRARPTIAVPRGEIENDGRVHCGHYGGELGRRHG